ncbi:hypothetical protein BUALT_Bualt15G0137900 [Buddleja alternifolia]|uniref:AT-rich interactive domain-containing protein 5 n=1 Tax=Buddleja alternifolia TaxID=168488 RepID=A0AAV6WGX1_9LAMI|nr:hypothetical protein BUALT_Bualt15G0137900 [Buddleja alternifolia]
MGKSEVEMEDPEKLPHDSRDDVQGPEINVLDDAKVESQGADVAGEVNKHENEGKDLNESRNEDKEKNTVGPEVKDQTNPKSEANVPMAAEESVPVQISTTSESEEPINTKTAAEGQYAPTSAVEKQDDPKNEVVKQHATNGVMKEEKSTDNGMEGAGPLKNVTEEKPNEDAAEKKHKEIGGEDAEYIKNVADDEKPIKDADAGNVPSENKQSLPAFSANEAPQSENAALDAVPQGEDEEMGDAATLNENKAVNDEIKEQGKEIVLVNSVVDENAKTVETAAKHEGEDSSLSNQNEAATPNSLVRYSPAKVADHSGERVKTVYTQATLPLMGESDDGTPEEQSAFMKELESFYRERAMDFKPPKFYGHPLNCLKLWRATIRLGGYDRVTGSKLWRQVGESFHPPKTCTTVSWTFRIFYEKSLLEYERHKTQSGELQLPVAIPEASGVDIEGNGYQGSGSGRARRDAAARAMQGWHAQRLFGSGEVGDPIVKDKNVNITPKREKNLKVIGSLKQKRPNEVEHSIKAARTETSKQLATSVVDVGPPADWVKVNVRETKDCFEVYALVPGLLREEVRVQSDPAGRVVITGQPEHVDNPWGITPFKKVVSLPARIDPLQTSAVVSLHGRLFVRVPFEQSNI